MGVRVLRTPLTLVAWQSNQESRALDVRKRGGGCMSISLSASMALGHSTLVQSGTGHGGSRAGVVREIRIGTWSEPVDAYGVPHSAMKGVREAEEKARSRTEGLPAPDRGNALNWVCDRQFIPLHYHFSCF